jgi:F-type H+-transporting ATPase subunit delta
VARINRKIAKKYARALLGLYEIKDLEALQSAVQELADTFQSNAVLLKVLVNPAVALDARIAAVREICGRIKPDDQTFGNFVATLLQNKRINLIPQVTVVFSKMIDDLRRLLALDITSAFALPPDEQASWHDRLKGELGSLVKITWEVNQDIVGGLIIRVGDRVLDGSVKGSLEKIRSQLLT